MRGLDGKTMVLRAAPDVSGDALRRAVAARTGIRPADQILAVRGRVLRGSAECVYAECGGGLGELADLDVEEGGGLEDNTSVDLSVRLRGGMVDGVTIGVFAVLGLIVIFAIYMIVKKVIQFSKYLWSEFFKRPCCWAYANVCTPCGHCCRWCVYCQKQRCIICFDGCDHHYHPWKKMEIAG